MNTLTSLFAICAIAPIALGQCNPSPTQFCVTHNGSVFVINGTPRQALTLTAGLTYTFTLVNTSGSHPFYLTTSSTGGGGTGIGSVANVTPSNPQTGNAIITFSPSMAQIGSPIFYQCAQHRNMGAGITVVRPLCPADFNQDGTVDFFDYLDFVDAFSQNLVTSDFNQDGVIDFFDYLDFVDAFSTPC